MILRVADDGDAARRTRAPYRARARSRVCSRCLCSARPASAGAVAGSRPGRKTARRSRRSRALPPARRDRPPLRIGRPGPFQALTESSSLIATTSAIGLRLRIRKIANVPHVQDVETAVRKRNGVTFGAFSANRRFEIALVQNPPHLISIPFSLFVLRFAISANRLAQLLRRHCRRSPLHDHRPAA